MDSNAVMIVKNVCIAFIALGSIAWLVLSNAWWWNKEPS